MSTVVVTNLKHESATGNNIILDSSGNAAFADGSASAPSITNDGDTNTGIYFPAADNIGFATGGTIRGRWTTDGLCFGSDTAAANALDDYEEGTWTPTWSGGSLTGDFTYTKIGRVVFASGRIEVAGTTSGDLGGLPFSSAADGRETGSVGFQNENGSTWNVLKVSGTNFRFYVGSTQQQATSGKTIRFSLFYTTS
jgi:prepilin-type processing-associated H-X9-DG protein